MSVSAAATRVEHLPKKLPIAIYAYNNWYTGRVNNCFGSKVHVCFDKMEDNTTSQKVPEGVVTVNRCVVVSTSALTFPCPYPGCEKAQAGNHFQDKSRWQQHIRMHNGTAPKCPICRSMDANLRRHIRKHRKEGPVRAPIVASDAEINTMKAGVIRATLDAANVTYKGLKGDAELRRRLIAHKNSYNAALVKAMAAVAAEAVPHYGTPQMQEQMSQYITKRLYSSHTFTVGDVMIDVMKMTGAVVGHDRARNVKKLLKRLDNKLNEIFQPAEPAKPSFFKAVAADEAGQLFKIDTNNDGQPDTFVKVVSPPSTMEGRWASTLKKRRLGAMKEEQLDVNTVLSSKDHEIRKLQAELFSKDQKIQTLTNALPTRPPRPQNLEIDFANLPPPIFPMLPGADSPALQFAASSQPLPSPKTESERPPSPRWRILERENLYDMALINMLKSLGYGTEKKYWKTVTTQMIDNYESQTGKVLKPGVKIKFLDMYGRPWVKGKKVEVEHNGTWLTGEVMDLTNDMATVISNTSVSQPQIVQVPREQMIDRIREPTQLTAHKERYEQLIEVLRRRAGCSSSEETDSSPETDRGMSSSPLQMNDETIVKEEQPDKEFDWHSLQDLKAPPSVQKNSCLPRIDTDAPWDSTPAQTEAGRMPAIGTYLQSGPNALRNVLPLIPKFRGPKIAKKPTDVEHDQNGGIPEPPQMFTG